MTKKRKAKGTAVRAWGVFRDDGRFVRAFRVREMARMMANVIRGSRVRPVRITILEGKG